MNRINRIKRKCALLLAIVMLLGVAFPPGIGGVFAQYTDDATEINEPIAEPGDMTGSEEESTEPGDMTGSEEESAEPDNTTGDAGESTESGETAGDAGEEPGETTGEQGEVCPQCGGANGSHSEDCPTLCTCGTETGEHSKDCPLYVCPECGSKQGAHSEGCTALVPVCTCGSETGVHSADCPLYEAPVCTCGSENGVHSEGCPLYEAPVCTCGSENGVHSTDCPLYEAPACTCGSENGVHSTDCPLYEAPVCTCGSENGVHSADCPLYEAPVCTCGSENGVHSEGCPLYKADVCLICGGENGGHHAGCPLHIPAVCPVCGGEKGEHSPDCTLYLQAVCPECGGKGGNHAETCSQYIAEQQNDPWAGLSAAEFAAWLTDADNGEQVKTILKQDGSQECNALRAHIDQILDGDDQKLAQQVSAYLAALLWLDQVNQLTADTGKTIYFDLAAGNVEIGKNSYSGYVYVYVNGIKTQLSVNGEHKTENQYYIYQSTEANRATTGYHVSSTTMLATAFTTSGSAYGFQSDLTGPSGVGAFSHASYQIPAAMALTTPGSFYLYQSTAANDVAIDAAEQDGSTSPVPEYDRVMHEGQSWTKYITNNTDVKKVSENWDTAAANSQRTPTGNYITFASESGYTANVTIDNIWSTYHHASVDRTTGGIGAHLDDRTDTHIHINLKGDNRVGCVHYSADRGAGNTIEFCNGETGDKSGSITVADFKTNWAANHWNAAIGAADNPRDTGDMSDGIVIHSGVIYAGTTPEDNCTAIGGGGNNYGGVTINGGTIYAYNLGIKQGEGDGFTQFVPAAAIGGGGSKNEAGGLQATITINGGTIYAQSMGGPGIGGGCSANSNGGPATIKITGGTIIAKSIGGMYGSEIISPGVSIGGGTGKTAGGSVTLNISEDNQDVKTILRTGSIGGGRATDGGKVGYAKVTVTGGDIIGQVIMAEGDANTNTPPCSFTMTDGVIHKTDVTKVIDADKGLYGIKIKEIDTDNVKVTDPQQEVPLYFIRQNGGAVFMDDPKGIANISGGRIEHCKANNGGVIYMEGGIVNISGGEINENTATNNGGAVYMAGGTCNLSELGTLWHNSAEECGGAIYVKAGDVNVSGGHIDANQAKLDGGGMYVGSGNIAVSGGDIHNNTAENDGGGMYIKNGIVKVSNSEDAGETVLGEIYKNTATRNGGGMYVAGGTVDISGGSIRDNTANEKGGGVYVGNGTITVSGKMSAKAEPIEEDEEKYYTISTTSIKRNHAIENGGGIYVDQGTITINSGEINYNDAKNGAGMYVGNGTVTMSNGSIHDNTAQVSGGGMYVSGTADSDTTGNVTINGGSVKFNKAEQDGGGVYAANGTITMNKVKPSDTTNPFISTEISYNDAINGGGLYVAGDVHMLDGSINDNTATENGGGFHVEDGIVLMYGGSIDHNSATANGGGMHVSATKQAPIVDIFSGYVSNNTAKNGGGVSVISQDNAKPIHVTVGVNCAHPDLDLKDDNRGGYSPFGYPTTPVDCGQAHSTHTNHISGLTHSTCPVVQNNTATDSGGGFFLDSPKSETTIYCMQARGNQATNDSDSNCMKVQGGKLQIGDEKFDTHDENVSTDAVKGNTFIEGTIMVEGGQMDVYGEMENPKFVSDVKVNVKEASDYYLDHRIKPKQEGIIDYKVHYYENFKNDDGTVTGLYIARQYPDEEHKDVEGNSKYEFTVMDSTFEHDGYKIVGWNTKPDDTGTPYDVNKTYNLKELEDNQELGVELSAADGHLITDDKLLVLYAIWQRLSYVLHFDPNVSEGESYTGADEMKEDQLVKVGKLDGSQKIRKNKFMRPDYKFVGWTLSPTPTDTDIVYEDGQAITKDFTEEDGVIVTLYANWEPCTHEGTLVYSANENILTEKCTACSGHTATATITALNADYDGKKHLATVNFSANWLGDKPEIVYDMTPDSTWNATDGIDDAWEKESIANRKPLHAGDYTASITAKYTVIENTDGVETTKTLTATAQTNYTINRIKWDTPGVPVIIFGVQNTGQVGADGKIIYNSIITITSPTSSLPTDNEPFGRKLMYKITHLPNGGTETDVVAYPNWREEKEFSNIPYGKYYYFYAKVCEDRDHMESDHSRSEAYLATGENVIYIKSATGIKVEPKINSNTGTFEYTVSADVGYHLRNYTDNLTNDLVDGNINIRKDADISGFVEPIKDKDGKKVTNAFCNENGIRISKLESTDGKYKYEVKFETDQVAYYQVTLDFSGAVKDATVDSKVTDGQVFSDFNSKETSISRDSSFTAQFTVKDYIPDEYTAQVLRFSQALPAKTTIILKNGSGYWYYNLAEAKTEIDLTDFIEMGGTGNFSFDEAGDIAQPFTYQFIVDFSQTAESERIDDNLGVSLALTADTSHSAPNIPADGEQAHISLGLETEAGFELKLKPASVGKSAIFDCTYTPSTGAAYIWNGRETALVLTAPETAPVDLSLTAVVSSNSTTSSTIRYTMNAERQFIIPLGELGSKEVQVTLNSALFDSPESPSIVNLFNSSEESLAFTARWYVAQSGADQSPLNGYEVASSNVTFFGEKDAVPSVRIDGTDRLLHAGEALNLQVKYSGISGGNTVTAYLQRKGSNGSYNDIGAKEDILLKKDTDTPRKGSKSVEFNMAKMEKGSYRILVNVLDPVPIDQGSNKHETGANILQVPYYFVIE